MIKLIKALKKQNLHIAIETTGNYPLEYLKQALPYLDLLLFDVNIQIIKKLKKLLVVIQNLSLIT